MLAEIERLSGLASTEEVAARVGLHPATVRTLAKVGAIPVVVIHPRLWRFDLEAVVAALADRAASSRITPSLTTNVRA